MKKWTIVILAIILFILSAISGFIVKSFLNFSKKDEVPNHIVLAEDDIKEVVDTSNSDIKVSPNAVVVMTQKYARCGHTVTKREEAPRDIVNLGEDEVTKFYKDWNVDSFSASEISLSRNVSGLCNEHYIIGVSDGFISISTRNDSGERIFKGLTDISVQYLPKEDLAKLENGIEIVGREELNKFLEDYE